MKRFRRPLAITVGVVTLFLIYVQLTYRQKYEVPSTSIIARSDSSVIARGKYLVMGPAHCFACHINDSLRALGLKEPLMGGGTYKTLFGTFNIPNITMDQETGLGNVSDDDIARAIRYGVNHRREAMPRFMAYNDLSNDDLTAIVSYLRTTSPVRHEVAPHDLNMLGKILMKFLLKPHLDVKVSDLTPDTTVGYGKYLAYTAFQCSSCHTKRSKTGEFVGEPFAGGFTWKMPDGTYTSPNLTPDDSTGHMYYWSEQVFIQRFKAGRLLEGSPMPWEGYQAMTNDDLKALYKFLTALPPVKNKLPKAFISHNNEQQLRTGDGGRSRSGAR